MDQIIKFEILKVAKILGGGGWFRKFEFVAKSFSFTRPLIIKIKINIIKRLVFSIQ